MKMWQKNSTLSEWVWKTPKKSIKRYLYTTGLMIFKHWNTDKYPPLIVKMKIITKNEKLFVSDYKM